PLVVPTVHQITQTVIVPLCIEGDWPEHGLVSALAQRLFDRFKRRRSRLFCCLGKNLDRGVSIQGVALGAEALGLEPPDHLSGSWRGSGPKVTRVPSAAAPARSQYSCVNEPEVTIIVAVVRVIDVFVDELDLGDLEFDGVS